MGSEMQQACEHGPWIPVALCGAVRYADEEIVSVGCPGGAHVAPVEHGVILAHGLHRDNECCPWQGVRVVVTAAVPTAVVRQ